MIDIEYLIKEISQKTKIEKEIVSIVCKHVFKETVQIMKDEEDTKDILFNKLFKFKLKSRYKINKQQKYEKSQYKS